MGKPKPNRSNWKGAKDEHKSPGKYKQVIESEQSTSGSFFVSTRDNEKMLNEKRPKGNFKGKPPQKDANTEEQSKKPFDKKKWRLQKYSKKYKLQQWEDKKKKVVLREYYKQIKHDDSPKFDVKKIYEEYEKEEANAAEDKNIYEESEREEANCTEQQEATENENNLNRDISEIQSSSAQKTTNFNPKMEVFQKRKPFQKAHDEFERIKREKQQRKEEIAKQKADKVEALKQMKQKKFERFKKLNKKTKKGQPVMKYRMEMLLEEIQKTVM